MATDIRIGTASWTDPGFVADWYPPKLPAGDRLRWYAEHFNYVEINATFYAIPNIRTVERWCKETPEDFLFDVKLPKLFSRHTMGARFLPPDLRSRVPLKGSNVELTAKSAELVAQRLLRELQPLFQSRKFGAFLLQMSPAFGPRDNSIEELGSVGELLAPHRLAIELRHRDWVADSQRERTLEFFRSHELAFVLVDAPRSEHFTIMPAITHVTNPKLACFRFHGRNERGYITGRTVAERFDYDYSDREVEELAGRIRQVQSEVEALHVVANNNRSNYAPRLAQRLQMLLIKGKRLTSLLDRKQPRQGQLL